jgi:hypothetical protein
MDYDWQPRVVQCAGDSGGHRNMLYHEVGSTIVDDIGEASDGLLRYRTTIGGHAINKVDRYTADHAGGSARDRRFDSASLQGGNEIGEIRLNASDDVSAIENVQDAHLAHQDR